MTKDITYRKLNCLQVYQIALDQAKYHSVRARLVTLIREARCERTDNSKNASISRCGVIFFGGAGVTIGRTSELTFGLTI